MNANEYRRAGHISMGFALVAAVVGALSLMSVTSTAFGGSDDGAGESRGSDDRGSDDRGGDRGGRGSDDGAGDDHGGRNGGHGADDAAGDDHGRRHGGHGADDGMVGSGSGVVLPLSEIAGNWEARGYRILDISREDGSVVEMDVIDPAGQRWEMYVDTATNAILSQHVED